MPTERKPGRWLPAWLGRLVGTRRRRRGLYDAVTEGMLHAASERSPTPQNVLAYLRFRRDLGHPPTETQAAKLLGHLGGYRGARARHAVNLLLEGGFSEQLIAAMSKYEMIRLANNSPPVAHSISEADRSSERVRLLAELHRSQEAWREMFADHLRNHRASLCVVGNAGTLVGSGLGERIDTHRSVTRFNRYRSDVSNPADTGTRIDVWVRAPDLGDFDPGADESPSWVVLSGADPRYHLAEWDAIVGLMERGAKVLTIPLEIWRRLVAQLHAPPSAGLMYLAWVMELLGGAAGLTAAGFQRPDGEGTAQYHQALPRHRASQRHRWDAERELLGQWQRDGLVFLGDS